MKSIRPFAYNEVIPIQKYSRSIDDILLSYINRSIPSNLMCVLSGSNPFKIKIYPSEYVLSNSQHIFEPSRWLRTTNLAVQRFNPINFS